MVPSREAQSCLFIMLIALMLTSHAFRDAFAAGTNNQGPTGSNSDSPLVGQPLKGQDCNSCHAEDHTVVGPSYVDIAGKYAATPGAIDRLVKSIREGETGTWGSTAMPPHRGISDAQLKKMVAWILSQKSAHPSATSTTTKRYTYTLQDGQTVTLDFPLFVEGDSHKVTKDVFRGYELYDSYCYRCHGQDATESELAPNLRDSLAKGMTIQQMIAVCMTGREEKGMPAWAGFLSEEDVRRIFMYIEGRRFQLIPVGRPPSADE